MKEIKNNLKSINYFYMLFQTNFTYFNSSIQRLNNLKIHEFLINFDYILFSFIFSMEKPNMRK